MGGTIIGGGLPQNEQGEHPPYSEVEERTAIAGGPHSKAWLDYRRAHGCVPGQDERGPIARRPKR